MVNNLLKKKVDMVNGHRLALLVIIILALFCVFLKIQSNKTIETLESNYSRSLYELVEYLDNVETLLAKAQISSSSEYAAKNLSEIWRKADLAQSALSQIPITHITLEKVMQYLNQLSDYSYSLSHEAIEGKDLTEEELNNIKDFYERAQIMNTTLNGLVADMGTGTISWSELIKKKNDAPFAQQVANISQDSFSQIEENMQDYEGLIYDGPFSEHMTSTEPLGLGDEKCDENKAKEKIYNFISKDLIAQINYNGLIENSTIKVHSFDVALNDGSNFYIDITEQGGHALWFMKNKEISLEPKLDFEGAKQKALEFLTNHGFENMKETYYILENNMATINFAYQLSNDKSTDTSSSDDIGEPNNTLTSGEIKHNNDIVCYPDLLKVKIALDTGDIIGLEAQSYYSSHHERTIEKPQITFEEARSKINKNLNIFSEGMAIIPTDWKTELLTYEFKGKVNENEFIVYVNAITGKEEKIFMIIDTPNGVLTV